MQLCRAKQRLEARRVVLYKNASKAVARLHWGSMSARLKAPPREEADFECYQDRKNQRRHLIEELFERTGLGACSPKWTIQLLHSAFMRFFFLPEADIEPLARRLVQLPKGKRIKHSAVYKGFGRLDSGGYNIGFLLIPKAHTVEVFRVSPATPHSKAVR